MHEKPHVDPCTWWKVMSTQSFYTMTQYRFHHLESDFSLIYEAPGGNMVDGLPPAASNGGREDCWPRKAILLQQPITYALARHLSIQMAQGS